MRPWMVCLMVATLSLPCWGDRADLVGALWWVSPDQAAWSREEWGKEFDAIQALGMNMLVLNGPWIGQELAAGQADPPAPLFEEADRRGIQLYLDTLAGPTWWTAADSAPEIARAKKRIETLQARYGRHASFHGFYVPYELYVMWDRQSDLIHDLYREVSLACKAADPKKPVLISPFFILDREGYLGDFRWATPEEYREFWTGLLKQAPVDIVALQDSGEHLSFYTMDERRPFFAAMKAACEAAGKTLWANVETGELEVASYEAYAERFGRKTDVNDAKLLPYWRGVPADKLVEKLVLARDYTPVAITWGYQTLIRPGSNEKAAGLYEAYRKALSKK